MRADISAFIKAFEVCDRDRIVNLFPQALLGLLHADQLLATLFIDNVDGYNSLLLGASPKSILTIIDNLTGGLQQFRFPIICSCNLAYGRMDREIRTPGAAVLRSRSSVRVSIVRRAVYSLRNR